MIKSSTFKIGHVSVLIRESAYERIHRDYRRGYGTVLIFGIYPLLVQDRKSANAIEKELAHIFRKSNQLRPNGKPSELYVHHVDVLRTGILTVLLGGKVKGVEPFSTPRSENILPWTRKDSIDLTNLRGMMQASETILKTSLPSPKKKVPIVIDLTDLSDSEDDIISFKILKVSDVSREKSDKRTKRLSESEQHISKSRKRTVKSSSDKDSAIERMREESIQSEIESLARNLMEMEIC